MNAKTPKKSTGLLIDQFLDGLVQAAQKAGSHPLLTSGMHALLQGVRLSQKFYFNESTMSMLMDKWQKYEETCQQIQHIPALMPVSRGIWYEFCEPIEDIKALFVWVPSLYLTTGKDCYQLVLIRSDSDICMMAEAKENEAWQPQFSHQMCRKCLPDHLCEDCAELLAMFSELLILSSVLAGQQLASVSYIEQTFHGIRHEKRQNSNKERRVPSRHLFRVIDACEIVIPIKPSESHQEHEKRGTWLDGTEIRVEIQTRPFSRTYRHERYKNVRGQTREFPEGMRRMQPMKSDHIERNVTKVKASEYEQST